MEVKASFCKSSEIFITRLCKVLCRSHVDQGAGSFLKLRISKALQDSNAACVRRTVRGRDASEDLITYSTICCDWFLFAARRSAWVAIFNQRFSSEK